ncbi:MAG: peptide deformylase [Candidatus Nealsonbacteria bacterium]|nr:peptide deformylase [Candidatus Nealsonbacteria bacterium]
MIREIKKYPDPILRKRAKEVKEITSEIKKLAEDMIETMLKNERDGVGLAGPQVGVSMRIFIAQTENGPGVFINPKILKKSGKTEKMEEGCLSLPKIWLSVKRAKELEIEAIDINGKKIKTKAEGIFARILQHEIDHLNGILIIDKVNLWQKFKRTLKRSK